MTTFSIYQKTCPKCASAVPIDIETCSCGYLFASDHDQNATDPETEILGENGLFEAYLAARMAQALQNLREAQAELAEDPKNFDKASSVMRAVHTLQTARIEHDAQMAIMDEVSTTQESSLTPTTEPSEEFKTQQAAKAAKIMEESRADHANTCPECAASVPVDQTRCACGYLFSFPLEHDGDSPNADRISRED
jgi:hypothetical protein